MAKSNIQTHILPETAILSSDFDWTSFFSATENRFNIEMFTCKLPFVVIVVP